MFKTTLRASTVMLAVFCAGALNAGVVLDRVVAVVNKEAVTWSELYKAMQFELNRQGGGKGLTEEQKKRIMDEGQAAFLENMIDVRLQLQEAERLGINVSEAEIDDAVEDVAGRFSMDEDALIKALADEGITMSEYRKSLSEQMRLARVVEREVKNKAQGNPANPAAGAEDPEGGELYRLRQIFFLLPEGGMTEELQGRVSAVLARIESGEDFGALAAENSEEAAGKRGGDLGFVRKDALSGEFMEALKGLKPGDVSKPFNTARGVHILKLEEVKTVKESLIEESLDKRYADWLRELRDKAFIDVRL